MLKKYFLISSVLLGSFGLNAQTHQKCYAHEIHKKAMDNNPSVRQKQSNLEQATKNYVANVGTNRNSGTILTIPVVVHIIHNGEAYGTGANIHDSLVFKQINRLNEDFRKTNSDTLPSTHPFNSLQADCEIEFCLASIDENGNSTTGITRSNEMSASWNISDIDNIIKPKTIWNRYDYLNLWCINLVDASAPGVDGYATFPSSTTDSTDGVVVANFAFAKDGFSGGKSIVATHEIGHYMNLLHIWGDNQPNCGNDSVADTPPAYASNSGCPTFPYSPNDSCGTNANGQMFMNYMDYSDASCTVMFSNGQKNRMLATLTTVRNSLTISGKCGSLSSISEDKINNDFTIYPNPNNGNFTINASKINNKNTTVFVYNSIGKVVKTFSAVNFPAEINLENLEQGVYFVSFKSKNSLITKKVHIVK